MGRGMVDAHRGKVLWFGSQPGSQVKRELRKELNLTKMEYASQLDERTRKLNEDRETFRREYEQKLRDFEKRRQG